MNFLKLLSIILIFCSGFTYAQSDLDRYYSLEEEVAKLRAQFRDNQSLISETNTTSNHFWSPPSTKKILGRLHKDQDRILKEMEPKIKELRRLEQTLEVKAWDYRFGILEQVNTILGNVSQNNTCSAQGQQLFTSDKAFEAWNAQNGDLDRKVAYYAQKNGYISNCLEGKDDGLTKHVSHEGTPGLCKVIDWWPDKSKRSRAEYNISTNNGKIRISTSIYLTYKGNPENKTEAFRRVEEAKVCMIDFFARHGIELDLTLKKETGIRDWWGCQHSVSLLEEGNANTHNWTSHVSGTIRTTEKQRCSEYLHELGHKLNLRDTYVNPDCPDRELKPRNDIMADAWGNPEDRMFYPSAIKKMLEPLCGE